MACLNTRPISFLSLPNESSSSLANMSATILNPLFRLAFLIHFDLPELEKMSVNYFSLSEFSMVELWTGDWDKCSETY